MKQSSFDLSIIVPTYHAAATAHQSVETLDRYFRDLGIDFEIILVDDGSAPNNRPDERRLPETAKLVQLPANKGKGYAVRTGLLAAKGGSRVFTDVDLPYGVDAILASYRAIADGRAHFVYGDRSLPGSMTVADPSLRRRLSSAVFRFAVTSIVGLPPMDTQCGLKGLSSVFADAVIPHLRTDHFAFDVEIFRCAIDSGIAATGVPVSLVNEDVSTVRLVKDSVTMLRDLVTIRQRAARGEYALTLKR